MDVTSSGGRCLRSVNSLLQCRVPTRSSLPEHITGWGYKLENLLFTSSFSLAARNASFFPVSPVGFNERCHLPPTVTKLAELIYKPHSKVTHPPSIAQRSPIDFLRAVHGLKTYAEAKAAYECT